MGPLGFDAVETALQLHEIVLYCIACGLAGVALVCVCAYIVLVCSEMFSQPGPKAQRAKAPQSARRVLDAEETLDLSVAETPILAAPALLGKEAVRVTAPPHRTQIRRFLSSPLWARAHGWRRLARREQVVHDGSFD